MHPWKWLTDYFDLDKRERRGTAFLLAIIFLFIILRTLVPYVLNPTQSDFSEAERLANELKKNKAGEEDGVKNINIQLFTFDPNIISEDSLHLLGFSSYVVSNLVKYRAKGGRIRRPEDLRKIYGLDEATYIRLSPYIQINKANLNPTIEINSADSAQLLAIRGIGPVFAGRIVKYRTMLGGFVNKEQLKQVYGIDDAHYKAIIDQLKVNPKLAKRIYINKVGLDELKQHALFYKHYKIVNAIINYRTQHGPYTRAEDLLKIKIMDKELWNDLKSYLVFD